MIEQIKHYFKLGWHSLESIHTAYWVGGLAFPSALPAWLSWDNAALRPYAILASLLIWGIIILCAFGYLGYSATRKSNRVVGVGGRGGSGTILGNNSTIIGGKGGDGGTGGIGGDGGSGTIHGDNGNVVGGDGGNAGTPDGRGGRGARSPIENSGAPTSFWPFGSGGNGANAPEYNRRLEVLTNIRTEYINSFPNEAQFINAGIDPVPVNWVNKRLEEMQQTWRVEFNNGGYKLPPLE